MGTTLALPSVPQQLPTTQAQWQQTLNVFQQWQSTLNSTTANAQQTSAEIAAGITPTNLGYNAGDLRRYASFTSGGGDVTTALSNAVAQAQETGGSPVYIPAAMGALTVSSGVTISTPITVYGDGPYSSVITAKADITVFTLTDDTNPGCVFHDFQLVGVGNQTAVITGYIVGTALTVSSVVSGAVVVGQTIRGIGTTNNATTGTTTFGMTVSSGSGSSWVVSDSGNVYSSGSPGKFYLGPANPAIVLTSSAYNRFERLNISGFGYGIELQTGGNSSFLNSFYDCVVISNSMANFYLQSQSHQTTLNACTFGGGDVGWGIYLTDSAGLSIFGSDCEGTAQVGIELDNVANSGNGAHYISGVDFEGNHDVGGCIRIGNTNAVNGVSIHSCTFSSGGAGDNYAVNPVTCSGLLIGGSSISSGFGAANFYTGGTLTNAYLWGNKGFVNGAYFGGLLVEAGTTGIGYATGNGVGGAVTQLTSRTTGVTLNTLAGAITMFTAAGSATPAEFTVTNSCVAANDVVLVTVKSGATNTYTFQVTATVGGSFNITFWTTGGTNSDTPILNFAVIKGAAN